MMSPRPNKGERTIGAVQSRQTWRDHWQAYRRHHQLVARESLERLLATPIASFLTCLVIAIALTLPSALSLALGNIKLLSRDWDGAAQITLYLAPSVTVQKGQALAQSLLERDDIDKADYISKEAALAEFTALSGFGDTLQGLSSNPLPAVIVVQPLEQQEAGVITSLQQELSDLVFVERAQLDLAWVQRLVAMMQLAEKVAFILALLLSLGVLLVIGNTIRLLIESRKEEILVIKLVGATDAFVRRPFLYAGFWFGLGGGLLASLMLTLTFFWLNESVAVLADLYDSQYRLLGLVWFDVLGLWLTGACLGLLGAWLAVGRHLYQIRPR